MDGKLKIAANLQKKTEELPDKNLNHQLLNPLIDRPADLSEAEMLVLLHKLEEHQTELEATLELMKAELSFENSEKAKRAAELILANKELLIQSKEKAIRTNELIAENKELLFQNEEKDKLASELIIANKDLVLQSEYVMISVKELALRNTELQKSEAQYRTVIESSLYAIVIMGEGKIIYANHAANTLFGATYENRLVGTLMLDRVPREFHQLVIDRIKKCAEDDVITPMIELKYLKLDGTILDVEVQSTPINYGGVQSIQTAIHDITERKRLQHQLEERMKELKTLFYLSQLAERKDITMFTFYQELVDFLP